MWPGKCASSLHLLGTGLDRILKRLDEHAKPSDVLLPVRFLLMPGMLAVSGARTQPFGAVDPSIGRRRVVAREQVVHQSGPGVPRRGEMAVAVHHETAHGVELLVLHVPS